MRVIVVGCGRMGSGLAQTLSLQGRQVSVIDHDATALGRLPPGFTGRTICGAGLEREALLQAGIERADALAAVTASDEVNAVVARLAKEAFRVPHVVARIYDPRRAEIYRRLGLQTISTTTWGIHRIAELLAASPVELVGALGGGGVELMQVEVPVPLTGRTVAEVTLPGQAQPVAISRAGKTFLPTPGAVFQERDVLHLAVEAGSAARVQAMLGIGELRAR